MSMSPLGDRSFSMADPNSTAKAWSRVFCLDCWIGVLEMSRLTLLNTSSIDTYCYNAKVKYKRSKTFQLPWRNTYLAPRWRRTPTRTPCPSSWCVYRRTETLGPSTPPVSLVSSLVPSHTVVAISRTRPHRRDIDRGRAFFDAGCRAHGNSRWTF